MASCYMSEYKNKMTTPQDAVERIKSGEVIVYGMNLGQPPALLKALADRVRNTALENISLYTFQPLQNAITTVLDPALSHKIRHNSWFVSAKERGFVGCGLSYYIPAYLHQIPKFCRENMLIDTVVTTVSPMDRNGYFTFGTANDYITVAARSCKHLIVEVNENMPHVAGDSLLHISEVEAVVENHVPLLELALPKPKLEDELIGPRVAELIPNEATIQLGLGNLPLVAARFLKNHKDLGVHSEMFTQGMVDLIECGVISGKKKNINRMKHLFTTALGTKKMYDLMHNNPSIEGHSAAYVCDPHIISLNKNMVAVNALVEVDLTGQINAEYLDGATISGVGGQLDFVRGAYSSEGGKSIHVFYSTAKDGQISRVVPRLKEGAIVSTPRADVHYIVSEYGTANLKGKSSKERALAIINLAHPKFRDELIKEAENMYLV